MMSCRLRVSFAALLVCGLSVFGLTPAVTAQAPSYAAGRSLTLQVLLDRAGFSPGEIDGGVGQNTQRAIEASQVAHDLQPTSQLDDGTWKAIGGAAGDDVLVRSTITSKDVEGPFVEHIPQDMIEKSQLPALAYTSLLEALAEKFHAKPALLRRLNPRVAWVMGDQIFVPHVLDGSPVSSAGPVTVIVSKEKSTFTFKMPKARSSSMRRSPAVARLPLGEWKVTGTQKDSTFCYNPALFWDGNPAHAKATIAAGPNNPVGVVWIDITKEHYGLHGTPEPGRIGDAESHGCVRLTNWDAQRVAALVEPGTRVVFQ